MEGPRRDLSWAHRCRRPVGGTADAATVRSEFFGIVQGQFEAEGQLDDTDLQGMAARKSGPTGSSSGGGRSSRARAPTAGIRRTRSSAPWPRTGSAPCPSCGGSPPGSPSSPGAPDRHRGPRAGVDGLPQGSGGPLRARRALLVDPLPAAVRHRAPRPTDHVLADLERAEPEEVLRPDGNRRPARPEVRRAAQISHDAITARTRAPRSSSPEPRLSAERRPEARGSS